MKKEYNKIRKYTIYVYQETPIIFSGKVYTDYMFSKRVDFGNNLTFWKSNE